jgi:hypothetical protein
LHKINSLNECEKPFIKTFLYKNNFENPLNECEKTVEPNTVKCDTLKNKKVFLNSLNECEKHLKINT